MLTINTNPPTEQRLNPHLNKHRKSQRANSFTTVQQHLFGSIWFGFWYITRDTTNFTYVGCYWNPKETSRVGEEREKLLRKKWISHWANIWPWRGGIPHASEWPVHCAWPECWAAPGSAASPAGRACSSSGTWTEIQLTCFLQKLSRDQSSNTTAIAVEYVWAHEYRCWVVFFFFLI